MEEAHSLVPVMHGCMLPLQKTREHPTDLGFSSRFRKRKRARLREDSVLLLAARRAGGRPSQKVVAGIRGFHFGYPPTS